MRKMTETEIWNLINQITWGTLCGVTPGGEPYGIEFTTFIDQGEICAIINPKGIMASCIQQQSKVCFKVCESSRLSRKFRAASFFGTAQFIKPQTVEEMYSAWEQLELRMQIPGGFEHAKRKYSNPETFLPILRIRVDHISGVTSLPVGSLPENNIIDEQVIQ